MYNKDEGNKLIAEFMGEEVWLKEYSTGLSPHKELKYHSSWDCLMKVIEKIDRSNQNIDRINEVIQLPLSIPIEIAWDAVIKFIDWQNNKQQLYDVMAKEDEQLKKINVLPMSEKNCHKFIDFHKVNTYHKDIHIVPHYGNEKEFIPNY